MKIYILILSFLVVFNNKGIKAQDREVFFQNLREESGLDYHLIKGIDQDKLGRLWAATYNGLYHYEGYEFKNIKNDPHDQNSISSNLCTGISINGGENIWLGTKDKGLNIKLLKSDTLIRIADSLLTNTGEYSSNILAVENASNELGYALTKMGLFEVLLTEEFNAKTRVLALPETLKAKDVYCLKHHPDQLLLVGTKKGLLIWDQKHGEWIKDNGNLFFIGEQISSLDFDQNGKIWLGVKNSIGIYTFDYQTLESRPYPFVADMSNANRVHICHDKNTDLWVVAGRQGVYRHQLKSKVNDYFLGKDYDLNPGNFTNFTHSPMRDSFGNIWFCGGGLHKWSNTGKRFFHYQNPIGEYQSTAAIYDDEHYRIQSLWGNGIVIWEKEKNSHFHMKKKDGLLTNTFYDIEKYEGNQYLLCGSGGCQVLDLKKRKVNFTIPLKGTVYDIQKENNNCLVVGSHGLWTLSEFKMAVQLLELKGLRGLAIDSQNRIWLASIANGMYQWNRKNGQLIHYTNKMDDLNSLQGNRIEDISIDTQGVIWLATSSGVESYDPKYNQWTNFLSDPKLANIRANSVLCLADSQIWVSNNNYISKFELQTNQWTHYNENDGIINPYFYERGGYINKKGDLFFAGRKGITLFHPNEIGLNPIVPRLFFEKINIDGIEHAADDRPIELSWRNKFVQFDFSGVHLTSPKNLDYSYRILPIQEEWIAIPKQPIFLNNLGTGDYTLEIMVETKDGIASAFPLSAEIIVSAPFWRNGYFWTVIFILSSLLIILWNQKRIAKIRKKAELNKRIRELEQVALQSQMNPHFIFNAMSGIQYFIVKKDEERALKYLSILGKLIRQILEYSNEKWISLSEEIELIHHYANLEKLRFNHSIEINIHNLLSDEDQEVYIPPLLLQPLVENAFTHGLKHVSHNNRKIGIEFSSIDHRKIQVSVEDNGVGRKAAEMKKKDFHNSQGSLNVQKRLTLVSQQMSVDSHFEIIDLISPSREAMGTKVNLHIPYKRELA